MTQVVVSKTIQAFMFSVTCHFNNQAIKCSEDAVESSYWCVFGDVNNSSNCIAMSQAEVTKNIKREVNCCLPMVRNNAVTTS